VIRSTAEPHVAWGACREERHRFASSIRLCPTMEVQGFGEKKKEMPGAAESVVEVDMVAPPTLGLGSPLPHLRRDWAHPCHIGAGTGLTPPTFAPGLGSPLPRLQ
jgi:hypothetical protein